MSAPAPAMSLRHDAEIIGLVGLAHGTSHFFHLMLPPLFPWLMRDFSLSFTEAGLLMTVFFVVSGVGQAVAGFVVDRVGARPVLFFGIGAAGDLRAPARLFAQLSDADADRRGRGPRQQHLSSGRLHAAESSRGAAAPGACVFGPRPVRQPGLGGGARLHGGHCQRHGLARGGVRRCRRRLRRAGDPVAAARRARRRGA